MQKTYGRVLFGLSILALAPMLLSCGSSNSGSATGQEAGKAFLAMFSSTSSTTQSGHFFRVSKELARAIQAAARKEAWHAAFDAVHARGKMARTQWCDSLTNTTSSSLSCTETCPANVFTTNCTLTSTVSAACGSSTTYSTDSGGTVTLSWPNGTIDPNFTNLVITVSMNITVSGGSFSKAQISLGFTFNFNDISQGNTTDLCANVQNFSATVNGAAVSCSDLATGISECK